MEKFTVVDEHWLSGHRLVKFIKASLVFYQIKSCGKRQGAVAHIVLLFIQNRFALVLLRLLKIIIGKDMAKYVLYLYIDTKNAVETPEEYIERIKAYKSEMRKKIENELLYQTDKLLILETRGQTYITKLE